MKTVKMIPFSVYKNKSGRYLAVNHDYGLKISGSKLGTKLTKVANPEICKSITVSLKIDLAAVRDDNRIFKTTVATAEEYLKSYLKTRDKKFRKMFFESVLASCAYFNRAEGRNYNLRDVGQLIKVISYKQYYSVLGNQYKASLRGRREAVTHAADITVVKSIKRIKENWNSIHGFSEVINQSVAKEFQIYALEMKSRGLTLNEIEKGIV